MEHKSVKIFTAKDNIEAEMILNLLKEQSIPAYKMDLGNAGIMNVYTGNSKAGEEIYVADLDAAKAMELLQGIGLE